MKNSEPFRTVVADFVGLAVLAALLTLVFYWFVHDDQFLILWILAYIVLIGASLGMWHGERLRDKAGEPKTWAVIAAVSIFLGALSFGVDMLLGSINNPGVSPIEAGTKAGGPFGFLLTLIVCPGVTMVALAGVVRAVVVGNHISVKA